MVWPRPDVHNRKSKGCRVFIRMAICRLLFSKFKLVILPICLILLLLYLPGCVEEFRMMHNSENNEISLATVSLNHGKNTALLRRSGPSLSLASAGDDGKQVVMKPTQKSTLCEEESQEETTDSVNVERTGYVLALGFHEQQTQAINNLFTLQCWAKTLLVNVVEPFIVDSYFVSPMNDSKQHVKFRDVFDIAKWYKLTTKHKFAPLASWHHFVSAAPRRLIVVRFRYLKPREYKLQKKLGEESVHRTSMTESYKSGCYLSEELETKIAYMVRVLNFTVIRDVCLNFARGDQITLFQFNRHVYERIGPKTVTVLMEEWRGFSAEKNGKRVSLFDGCWLSVKVQSMAYALPSKQLIGDANKYRKWYLKTESYIALLVRTEKMHSLSYDKTYMAQCLNNTLTAWRRVKKAAKIHKTFLSMDIGKYGSYTLMERKGDVRYRPYMDLYTEFLKELFGGHATIRTWEMGFEEVASKQEPGYIASLQKTIATMSRCIILSGGGSFQKHALYMYRKMHKNVKQCSVIIEDCSRGI